MYFTNIGPNLASKIPNEQGGFEKYLANCNTFLNDAPLTDEEVRNAFYSLKTNKTPGYDNISFNAVNNVFDFLVEPIRCMYMYVYVYIYTRRNENCTNNAHIQRWR